MACQTSVALKRFWIQTAYFLRAKNRPEVSNCTNAVCCGDKVTYQYSSVLAAPTPNVCGGAAGASQLPVPSALVRLSAAAELWWNSKSSHGLRWARIGTLGETIQLLSPGGALSRSSCWWRSGVSDSDSAAAV